MSERPSIRIRDRIVGHGRPAYIVAEMSANHHRDFGQAVRLVQQAHAAGADAIKLQTYTADTLTLDARDERFRIRGSVWNGQYLHDLYREAYTPWEWQPKLKAVADDLGLDLFSSPFDATAVRFLDSMNVPAIKIASPELVDIGLIQCAARTGRPLILSTGMAAIQEIDAAVTAARAVGGAQIALLKCTSSYPAAAADMNLRTIPDMEARFSVPVGLSDHTLDAAVAVAAVSVGACIVEKHLTLSRADSGPDSSFSLEPQEFRELVRNVRLAESALGEITYGPTAADAASLRFRRSLFVVADMSAGDTFTPDVVRSIRPGDGLPPQCFPQVLGCKAAIDIPRGTPLTWDLVDRS